jgi:hypothetical protein
MSSYLFLCSPRFLWYRCAQSAFDKDKRISFFTIYGYILCQLFSRHLPSKKQHQTQQAKQTTNCRTPVLNNVCIDCIRIKLFSIDSLKQNVLRDQRQNIKWYFNHNFYQTKKKDVKKKNESMNIRPCSFYLYLLLFILTLTVALLSDKQQY